MVVNRADGAVLGPADVARRPGGPQPDAGASPSPGDRSVAPPTWCRPTARRPSGWFPISADLSGLALGDAVAALRTAADTGLPAGCEAHVTGGPAFGADIANAFTDANVTLLAVTASVVALLLIATYRSPVLWLVPLLVIGFADRVATSVGTAVASLTGLSFDGATSGITSVLVFGAGTNYALLLISRYRQELRRHADHRDALRRAVRMAGPAIVASNATVVLALLTLMFASTPSTRSLGALAACGLVVAAVSVLAGAAAAAGGVRPAVVLAVHSATASDGDGGLDAGPWHRVAEWVARRPAAGRHGRDRGSGDAGHRTAGYSSRFVADRAIPGPRRFGVRLRRRGRALSRRPGQSHAGRRPHRPGAQVQQAISSDPRRRLGDRVRPVQRPG